MLMIAGVHLLGWCVSAVLISPRCVTARSSPAAARTRARTTAGAAARPPAEAARPPRGGIPLPDAEPASDAPARPPPLAEQLPARERRPAREPRRATPVHDRTRDPRLEACAGQAASVLIRRLTSSSST